MVGLRRTHELHIPSPSTKPNWPRRSSSFAAGPISLKRTVCAVAGVAVLAIAPASALAISTPSPDPAPGSSTPAKPKPAPKPVVHTAPKPTYTAPKVTTQPKTTYTPPAVVHTTPAAPVHKAAPKHKARHRKHTVVHHKKKKHVAAAPKVTPAPVQTPAAQVVNTKPTAVHAAPVALHKATDGDSNGRFLAFAALALLVLAGASAWMLRYTLRLAQPQRTY
jgi:hypothetical protein